MVLGYMEDDRASLEQGEIAFLIGRDLTERMKRQMRGFLHRTERNKANLVGLARFFERPANARVARQPLAAIGRSFKGGNDDGHHSARATNDSGKISDMRLAASNVRDDA